MARGDPWSLLEAGLVALSIDVDSRFFDRIRIYIGELQRWNAVARLSGYRDPVAQILHLVLESLLLLRLRAPVGSPLLDIGSGPGVPGLVLQLARPSWEVTLVEANRRRANFLRHAARKFGLEGLVVHQERAEALATRPGLQGAFVTVTMRAVLGPERAGRLARPFLRPDGCLVLPGGTAGDDYLGETQTVRLELPDRKLSLTRRILIIPATTLADDGDRVPRGTRGTRGTPTRRGEPEGRGRKDHDRGEPGGRPGGR